MAIQCSVYIYMWIFMYVWICLHATNTAVSQRDSMFAHVFLFVFYYYLSLLLLLSYSGCVWLPLYWLRCCVGYMCVFLRLPSEAKKERKENLLYWSLWVTDCLEAALPEQVYLKGLALSWKGKAFPDFIFPETRWTLQSVLQYVMKSEAIPRAGFVHCPIFV